MMKIAIIGSGISGLGAAYLLHKKYDITLYEKNDYLGGHSRTINVALGQSSTPVDTGFIVCNNWNYPNLLGLFEKIDVRYEDSDMSFGVSIDDGWLEYGSSNIFAQKRNLWRPAFWGMLYDIIKFNRAAERYIEKDVSITLGQCLDDLKMGSWFRQYYLLAMGAAIWSCPIETILKFPAKIYLRFFKNHGLLNIIKRPQWYTVTGGSRVYVHKLKSHFEDKILINQGIQSVAHNGDGFTVSDVNGRKADYDQVIFACHADEALSLIQSPSDDEKNILSAFTYQKNHIIVHTDDSFMPKNKNAWASWVYLSEGREDKKDVVSLSYWMNNLQNFKTSKPVFVTLNPGRRPDEDTILDEHNFTHPIFDGGAISAQDKIELIQGQRGLWFCGAYQRYGFHEDGLWSAVRVAKALEVDIPWE